MVMKENVLVLQNDTLKDKWVEECDICKLLSNSSKISNMHFLNIFSEIKKN